MKHELIHPFLMWAFVIIGIIIVNVAFSAKIYLLDIAVLRWLLLPAVAYWCLISISAQRMHKQAAKSVANITKINKTGIYGAVRHPMYSSNIILTAGIFFFRPTLRILLIAVWMIAVFLIWMNLEEKALEERFGDEYKKYKKKVPMFLPRF